MYGDFYLRIAGKDYNPDLAASKDDEAAHQVNPPARLHTANGQPSLVPNTAESDILSCRGVQVTGTADVLQQGKWTRAEFKTALKKNPGNLSYKTVMGRIKDALRLALLSVEAGMHDALKALPGNASKVSCSRWHADGSLLIRNRSPCRSRGSSLKSSGSTSY